MEIVRLNSSQFDNFAKNHKYRSFYQSSMYGNLIKQFGYNVEYIGIINDEKQLQGASLIMYKVVFMKNKIGYCPRGILFNYDDPNEVKKMTTLLKKYLKKKDFMTLRMDPYIPLSVRNNNGEILNINNEAENNIKNIVRSGFSYKGKTLYFEGEKPRWEALTLLNRDIREIFAKFDKRTRNKIRRATSLGIDVIKSDNRDINSLYRFLRTKEHKPISYYQKLIENFGDNISVYYANINTETFIINARKSYEQEVERNNELTDMIQNNSLDQAERNNYINQKIESDVLVNNYRNSMVMSTELLKKYPMGLPVAGAIVIEYDNAAFLFIEGVDDKYKQLNPSYLLKWKLIELYNDKQYKYFNLNGVVGNFDRKNKYAGLNEMKLGFDTTVTEYIGEFETIVNNFNYKLYKKLNKSKK